MSTADLIKDLMVTRLDTFEHVVATLREAEIRGGRSEPQSCPVAIYLMTHVPQIQHQDLEVQGETVMYLAAPDDLAAGVVGDGLDHGGTWVELEATPGIRDFIVKFDDGKLPEFEWGDD